MLCSETWRTKKVRPMCQMFTEQQETGICVSGCQIDCNKTSLSNWLYETCKYIPKKKILVGCRDWLVLLRACDWKWHLLVFIAIHHPGDADTDAEGRQQQHADLRPFVQVRQVVLWDPEWSINQSMNMTRINTSQTSCRGAALNVPGFG